MTDGLQDRSRFALEGTQPAREGTSQFAHRLEKPVVADSSAKLPEPEQGNSRESVTSSTGKSNFEGEILEYLSAYRVAFASPNATFAARNRKVFRELRRQHPLKVLLDSVKQLASDDWVRTNWTLNQVCSPSGVDRGTRERPNRPTGTYAQPAAVHPPPAASVFTFGPPLPREQAAAILRDPNRPRPKFARPYQPLEFSHG